MSKKSQISRRKSLQLVGLATTGLALSACSSFSIEGTNKPSEIYQNALAEMKITREFLADWFSGRYKKTTDEGFYLDKVLVDNFTIIRPDGKRFNKEQTLKIFSEKLFHSEPTVIRHDNRDIQLILDTGSLVIVGYKESHVYPDYEVVNELTAVLVEDVTAPNNVKWQLVHETQIAQ